MNARSDPSFLPDFCADGTLLLVVVIAELLAVVLALAAWPCTPFWQALALTSLFVQWIALASVAALCRLRRLAHTAPLRAALTAYAVVVGITVVFSVLAAAILDRFLPAGGAGRLQDLAFVLRNGLVSAIMAAVGLRYLYVQHDWKRGVEARMESRLQALQARIRPHFLFNSMNSIAALIRQRPAEAEQAVEDLSSLFRAVLREGEWSRLGDEIALARHYLALESLRLGERLRVDWRIDLGEADMDAPVPALILQPLVENAVYHGIQALTDGGEIGITIGREKGKLCLQVENPKPAVSAARGGQGMALANIRERLKLGYRGAKMEIRDEEARFSVKLLLPREAEHANHDRR